MMNIRLSGHIFFLALAAALMAVTACSALLPAVRDEIANRIAGPSFMQVRHITAKPFVLTVFERVWKRGMPATVYIEGDGMAYFSRNTPSLDPTPVNPIALHLASRDNGPNVIYLARPCQYTKMADPNTPCPNAYWTSGRFSSDVIDSMSTALDDIKIRYRIEQFNLVGFSGGAAVAVLLAASRNDIVSIRTVAGNLDPKTLNTLHGVSQLTQSLDPRDAAAKIAHIPQHHFIGDWDEIVTPPVFDAYRAAAGRTSCIRSSIVHEATHETGWVNQWPELLKAELDCNAANP